MMVNVKKTTYILCFFLVGLLASCGAQNPGPKKQDQDYEPGKSFQDFYGDYITIFHLEKDELQLVGDWIPREGSTGYIANYGLTPNHRAFLSVGLKKRGTDGKLGFLDGIWELRQGTVYIKVYILGYITDVGGKIRSFPQMTVPFETAIIKLKEIHPDGYSLKPFAQIRLRREVEHGLAARPNYAPNYMYRSLRSEDVINGGHNYVFKDIDFMARYPDARAIFKSLASYEAYIEEARAFVKANP